MITVTLFRVDGNLLGEGILLYVREDILSKSFEVETKPIESFHVEINQRNDQWLINSSYNPHKNMIGNHLRALSEKLEVFLIFFKL